MPRDAAPNANRPDDHQLFALTRWSLIRQAKDESATALNTLCLNYRAPLLVLVRCRNLAIPGYDAEDLVQGFFAVLLRRDFLANVAEHKGRFRTFLLNAFEHFLSDLRIREAALKRGAGVAPDSLHETDGQGQLLQDPAAPGPDPGETVDRAWAEAVLAAALRRLTEEAAASGHAALVAALEPVFFADDAAPSYAEIAGRLGLTEGAVKTAAHRMRKRLGALIREEVRDTVANEADLEAELAYLLTLFRKPSLSQ